jgi:ADP-ribose diphosphatase
VTRPLPIIHEVRRRQGDPHRVVEELDLEFSNGERRLYHRAPAGEHGAVIVVPMLDHETALLIREYAAGTHRYELGLVKGRIDAGESPEEAANRELKEEAGYMGHETILVLARDLYEERLPGDEPELLDVVPWKLDALHELILAEDFSEGRSIAALFLVREWLRHADAE